MARPPGPATEPDGAGAGAQAEADRAKQALAPPKTWGELLHEAERLGPWGRAIEPWAALPAQARADRETVASLFARAILPDQPGEDGERAPWMLGRVTCDPHVMGGVPCCAGTRIDTATVWAWRDESREWFAENFPRLTDADIAAALAFEARRREREEGDEGEVGLRRQLALAREDIDGLRHELGVLRRQLDGVRERSDGHVPILHDHAGSVAGLREQVDRLLAERDADLAAMAEAGNRLSAVEGFVAGGAELHADVLRRVAAAEARLNQLSGGVPSGGAAACSICEGRGWSVNVPSGSMYPCTVCGGSGRPPAGGWPEGWEPGALPQVGNGWLRWCCPFCHLRCALDGEDQLERYARDHVAALHGAELFARALPEQALGIEVRAMRRLTGAPGDG